MHRLFENLIRIVFVTALVLASFSTFNIVQAQAACERATACFEAKLNQPNITADFYLNGNLVMQNVNSARLNSEPNKESVIEARNIRDAANEGFGDLYTYNDLKQSGYASGGAVFPILFSPTRTYTKGTAKIKVAGWFPDAVAADLYVDGNLVASQTANKDLILSIGDHKFEARNVSAPLLNGRKEYSDVTQQSWVYGGGIIFVSLNSVPKPQTAAQVQSQPSSQSQPVQASNTPAIIPNVPSANTNHLGTERVVIADYMMWYDPWSFDGTKTFDIPLAGGYNSDEFGVIQRQVAQAREACLDGFSAHWYGMSDSRTTRNFGMLLDASVGTGLRHAIVMQTNILPEASEELIAKSIRYIIENWAGKETYLKLGGKPVIIFTDMPRPWGNDQAAYQGWLRIRNAVDPDHKTIWMAEGFYPTFNPLFDGLYVYRVDHKDFPQAWLKQSRWAAGLRQVEQTTKTPLYFADTIAPGFDDTRSHNAPGDLRDPSPAFARDRRNGAYYTETFAATAYTGGDFMIVKSFNEWIEGTAIEPGTQYGNLYMNLTCQFAKQYRGR